MSKTKKTKAAEGATSATKNVARLSAKDDAVDPALASLFATSSGPVTLSKKIVKPVNATPVPKPAAELEETSSSDSDSDSGVEVEQEEGQKADDESGSSSDETSSVISDAETLEDTKKPAVESDRQRKRKRNGDEDELEQAYFKRLQREEDKETKQRREEKKLDNQESSSDSEDDSDSDDKSSVSEPSSVEVPLRHEIFDKKLNDQDKVNRTVFLGNVSTEAIKLKSAKRVLARHLRSVLKTPAHGKRPGKLESLRFRSTAYTAKSGPKKATFAKKELMDQTTTSTNAYAVFTTEAAAEHVAKTLNGSVVLDRHLRVDHLAKPLAVDHKRCVFIGNLSFVNEETPPTDQTENRRPTAKQPADSEEGLWRTFNKCGRVESVRVVRDEETRVSKGFAYVQFQDENSVEAALLMNEKKFPPMLPRKLRVMRARKTKVKPSPALPYKGRPTKNSVVRGHAAKSLVFEGHRASEGGNNKGKLQGRTDGKREGKKKRPNSNSAKRGAQFKRAQIRKRQSGEGK